MFIYISQALLVVGLAILLIPTAKAEKPLPEANFKNEVQLIQPLKADESLKLQQELAPVAVEQPPTGTHEQLMAAAGIQPSDYAHVEFIVSHESGWRHDAANPSGAYGLCQSLPASKMATAGADWQTNPITQLKWCNSYANRYGGWAGSHAAWVRQNWW